MKVLKFYFLFKISLIVLTLCHFVAAVLKESEENIGTNEINTKFVNALQVSETNKRRDFEDSDHKLKMSVVNSGNPESRVNSFVYLMKHEELKGFLKTLPIEILRKLRTLASKDIDSAQKFVIRLAQERKKKWGDQGIAERLGMISEARAKPLISDTATTNPIDKDSIDSSNTTRRINSMSKFLRNYKFTPTPSIDNVNEESHNPWKPIAGAPSTTSDNSTTVTYIVHEVLHPKHPYLNQSTHNRGTSTTSTTTTTEEYPSVLSPMTNPPPTPPMSDKTPNPNYRPTILHHNKSNELQLSVDNAQKIRDNYYSGSRQHRGSKFKQLKDSWPQPQNSLNPTTLLPHAQGGVTQYTWGIAPGVVDAHSYYINPTHLATDDQGPGDTPSDVQNMNNYNYPDYPALSYPYQGVWKPNTIPGYNIKNSFNQDSTRNSLPTHNMAHNNVPYSYQQVTYPVVQTNEANYHSNRSPANYYMLHPPPSNYYYNNELQNPSNVGHGHSHNSHRGDKDYKYSSSDLHHYHGSGWTHTDSDNSHEYKGMIHKVKAYFYKGDRSAAEKVFEVSLGILAFLAFGGYLLMLIYQVFAATSAVPLFPLVTQAVPSNTGLFGILFGRNLDPKSGFNKYLNTQLDSLEKQVTIAFNNVISKFYIKEEDDKSKVQEKQNEL